MKRIVSALCTAVLAAGILTQPAAAEDLMTLRLAAGKTVFTREELEQGDHVVHGGLYIDNYTGIAKLRLILRSTEPVSIENGGFTLDPNGELDADGKVRHAFFEEHSEISYTAKSLVDNDTNIVLWYGGHVDGHENYYDNGVIRDANSSFLSFDYRIPKGTPSGDYTCYISEKVNTTQSGLIMEDLTISDAKHRLEPGKDFALKPITFTVYERGDFNCDGTVSIDDAQSTLLYYVRKVVSKLNVTDEDLKTLAGTEHTGAARLAADASGDGTLDASDPQGILNYYVIAMTNQKPDWNKIYRH